VSDLIAFAGFNIALRDALLGREASWCMGIFPDEIERLNTPGNGVSMRGLFPWRSVPTARRQEVSRKKRHSILRLSAMTRETDD
jgi:hypothetical protein